jgi:hypothetical protein
MSKNCGILYALKNDLWGRNLKCGLTTQKIEKRISNLQTSLFIDCELIATTNQLVNCKIYEFLLKKVLKECRLREDSQEKTTVFSGAPKNNFIIFLCDREFFNVEIDLIKEIFDTFNYINSILDTEEKLNNYILNNYPEYFKKRKYVKSETSSSEKPKRKRRKGLFVDTSY